MTMIEQHKTKNITFEELPPALLMPLSNSHFFACEFAKNNPALPINFMLHGQEKTAHLFFEKMDSQADKEDIAMTVQLAAHFLGGVSAICMSTEAYLARRTVKKDDEQALKKLLNTTPSECPNNEEVVLLCVDDGDQQVSAFYALNRDNKNNIIMHDKPQELMLKNSTLDPRITFDSLLKKSRMLTQLLKEVAVLCDARKQEISEKQKLVIVIQQYNEAFGTNLNPHKLMRAVNKFLDADKAQTNPTGAVH
jgi:hypothetical protein